MTETEIETQIQAALKKHIEQYHVGRKKSCVKIVYTDDFLEFWKFWPGRYDQVNSHIIKVGKREAAMEWVKLSEQDKLKILALVKTGKIKNSGWSVLPDALRWLGKRRWEDFS